MLYSLCICPIYDVISILWAIFYFVAFGGVNVGESEILADHL